MTIKSFAHIHNSFLISSVRRSMFDAQAIYDVSVTHSLCVNGERCVQCVNSVRYKIVWLSETRHFTHCFYIESRQTHFV